MRLPSFVDDLAATRLALEFAAARHTGQRRRGDLAPFILHPLEVAHLLRDRDYPDEVVAAGVLHDVIEDAGVTRDELEERFGAQVAELVSAVSEPSPDGSYRERKSRLRDAVAHAEPEALAIFTADKVAKLRELRIVIATTPEYVPDEEQLSSVSPQVKAGRPRPGGTAEERGPSQWPRAASDAARRSLSPLKQRPPARSLRSRQRRSPSGT